MYPYYNNATSRGRVKKSITSKVIVSYMSVMAIIFSMALFDTQVSPTEKKRKPKHKDITVLTDDEYQQYLNDIKAVPWQGGTGRDNSLSNKEDNKKKYTYASDDDFVIDNINVSSLTETEKQMIREFVQIMNKASEATGAPQWALCGELAREQSFRKVGNSGIFMPQLGFTFEQYGKPWGSKVYNYSNTCYQMYKDNAGKLGGSDTYYDGPFQFTSGSADENCNLLSAATKAGKRYLAQDYGMIIKNYFQGVDISNDVLNALLVTAHNTGPVGLEWRIPKDARQRFADGMGKVFNNKDAMIHLGKTLMSTGTMSNDSNRECLEVYDLGFDNLYFSPKVVSRWNAKVSKTGTCNISSWPAGKAGDRSSPEKNQQIDRLQGYGNCYLFTKTEQNNPDILMSYIEARYLTGGYAAGKTMWNTLNKVLEEMDKGTGGGTSNVMPFGEITYYWRDKLNRNKKDVSITDSSITGDFGEVGYKGTFPLFIQGTGVNDISNLPWKFGGSNTTLGSSGCSLFSLLSLIHGVGYGDLPFPNKDLTYDGLNDKGYICFEELSKVLTNGPVLADDANRLGYITKSVPTNRSGLEELYGYLTQGIPFIVNVRYGDVCGYDKQGNKHIVHFTNSGHFMILSGAYTEGGKRYVQVVQSTYSKAGTVDDDENQLVFDYDELIEKEIIRSSFGSEVPAYTIVGRKDGLREPIYMNSNYKVSESEESYSKDITNTDTQASESINNLIETISTRGYINLPTEMYVDIETDYADLYVTDKDVLRISNINYYTGISGSKVYERGDYIGLIDKSSRFTRYLVNQEGILEEVLAK